MNNVLKVQVPMVSRGTFTVNVPFRLNVGTAARLLRVEFHENLPSNVTTQVSAMVHKLADVPGLASNNNIVNSDDAIARYYSIEQVVGAAGAVQVHYPFIVDVADFDYYVITPVSYLGHNTPATLCGVEIAYERVRISSGQRAAILAWQNRKLGDVS